MACTEKIQYMDKKKPARSIILTGLYSSLMVEAAGVEPASENTPL